MAAARQIGHDFDYLDRRFAELGICWERVRRDRRRQLASGDVDTFVTQWIQLRAHRDDHARRDYTHAGGSWASGSNGRYYGGHGLRQAVRRHAEPPHLRAGSPTSAARRSAPTSNGWSRTGITTGCATTRFCPTSSVASRADGELPERAHEPPGSDRTTGSPMTLEHAPGRHQQRRRGRRHARLRCGSLLPARRRDARPDGELPGTRPRPAADRRRTTSATTTAHRTRMPSTALPPAGITRGCAPAASARRAIVTREQMAAFLHRAFG